MASNIRGDESSYEALVTYFGRMGYHTGCFGKQQWYNLVNPFDEVGEAWGLAVEARARRG